MESTASPDKMDEGAAAAEQKQELNGDCIGPNSMYIKLVSNDGHEFIIKRELALLSATIRDMLSGPGTAKDDQENKIIFHNVPSHIMRRFCMFMNYKGSYKKCPSEVPVFPIPSNEALDLLLVANFLEC